MSVMPDPVEVELRSVETARTWSFKKQAKVGPNLVPKAHHLGRSRACCVQRPPKVGPKLTQTLGDFNRGLGSDIAQVRARCRSSLPRCSEFGQMPCRRT